MLNGSTLESLRVEEVEPPLIKRLSSIPRLNHPMSSFSEVQRVEPAFLIDLVILSTAFGVARSCRNGQHLSYYRCTRIGLREHRDFSRRLAQRSTRRANTDGRNTDSVVGDKLIGARCIAQAF